MSAIKRIHLLALKNLFGKITIDSEGNPQKISSRLAYCISRSESRMKEELTAIDAVMKPYHEYEEKRLKLCKELCEKGPDGAPVMLPDGKFKGVDEHPDWHPRIDALKAEYEKQVEEVNKMLDEEVEIDFFQADVKDLPAEMSKQDMDILLPFLREPS